MAVCVCTLCPVASAAWASSLYIWGSAWLSLVISVSRLYALSFYPDVERFPCLELAFRAMAAGDNAPAVLNAANEVAVEMFLGGRIGFKRIPQLVEAVLDALPGTAIENLEDVMEQDRLARSLAIKYASK